MLSSRLFLQSPRDNSKLRCPDAIKKKFSELNHAISLENRGLAQFPVSYYSCMTSNVRIIDLRNNKLKAFPDSLSVFKNLESLRLDNNSIQSIPEGVFKDIKPKIFSICNNYLKAVPGEIGLWDGCLESLNLASNFIATIPKDIGGLKNLKLLHINNNSFIGIPAEMGRLTGLRELGLDWFRYVMPGGNIVLNSGINAKAFQLFLGCLREKQPEESFSIKEFFTVFARKMGVNSMKNGNNNANNNKIMIKQANKMVFESVFNEDLGVLRYLISENTDIMKTINTDNNSPLSYAIQEEKYLSAKLLIQSGADVNLGGGDFACPLNIGVTKMQIYLVKDLFKYGASPNVSNKRGDYSLSFLFDEWCLETDSLAYKIFNLLMEHGAQLNRRNEEGETPLHRVIVKKQKTVLKTVAEYNSRCIGGSRFDFTKKTRKKRGCIHLAAAAEDFDAVQIVLGNDEVLEQLFDVDIEGLRPIHLAKKSYSCVKIIRKYEKVYELRNVLPQKSSKRTVLTGEENSNDNIGLEEENESMNGTLSMKMRSINVLNAKNSILNARIFAKTLRKTPVRVILDEKRNIEDSNDSIKTDFDEENNSNSSGKKRFEVKKLPLSPNNIKKIERIQKYSQYFTRSQTERIVLQSGRRLTLDERDKKTTINTTSKVFLANVYKEVINKFEKYHKRLSDLKPEIVNGSNLLSVRLHCLFSVFRIHDKLMKIARNLIEKRVSLAIVNINLFESSQINEEQIKRGLKLGESMQSFLIVFGVLETVLREIEAQNCYDSRVVRHGIARFAGFFGGNGIFGERVMDFEEMAVRFELAQGRKRNKNV